MTGRVRAEWNYRARVLRALAHLPFDYLETDTMNPFAKPDEMKQEEYDRVMRRVQLAGDADPENTLLPSGMSVADARRFLAGQSAEPRPAAKKKTRAPRRKAATPAPTPRPEQAVVADETASVIE